MLFGSATLDIAIGMILLYYLLSMICSAINEGIASLLRLRANTLVEGITSLLNDADMQSLIDQFFRQSFFRSFKKNPYPTLVGLTQKFYAHPLIQNLGRKSKAARPAYISAATFVQVVLDLISPSDGANPTATPVDIYEKLQKLRADTASQEAALAKILLPLIEQAGLNQGKVNQVQALRQAVTTARATLNELMADAAKGPLAQVALDNVKLSESRLEKIETDIAAQWTQAQTNIENHFNDVMDRASGWYKRSVQKILLLLAIFITLVLNADSITIGTQLANSAALRSAASEYAQKIIAESPTLPSEVMTSTVASGNQTVSGSPTMSDTLSNTLSDTISDTKSISETVHQVDASLQAINEIGYAVGWTKWWAEKRTDPGAWLLKLLGLLITAAAVSMGAPFWFDLLNKVVNVRSAGEKPKDAAGK